MNRTKERSQRGKGKAGAAQAVSPPTSAGGGARTDDDPAHLHIEYRPLASLVPYARNARTHSEAQVAQLAASIREYRWTNPVLVDGAGGIIAGHARVLAARQLGLEVVPVIELRHLSEAQKRAYVMADNQLAMNAGWDVDLLRIELTELKELGTDLGLVGFTDADLRKYLAGGPEAGLTGADDVEEPPAEPITRPGDLWVLGDQEHGHRLLCGDSTNPADVQRVMHGQKAALMATDPPYLVSYTGERPNDSGKDWTDVYHEVDIKDADGFFRAVFTNILKVIAPHSAIYCWHAHKRQAMISRVWADLGILDHQQVVWVKPVPVFGRVFWHFRHEPCMMGWVQGSAPTHDGDQTLSSVWEIDWEGKARIVGNEHPTQKPVEVFARPMRKHTLPGDICFEPFSGSGSQIIAAEQNHRRCYAIEIEPRFVDCAVQRWEKFTGKKAQRIPSNTLPEEKAPPAEQAEAVMGEGGGS